MALPTLEKTYTNARWSAATLGNVDNDNRNLFMNCKDLLVAAGWTVVGSSGNGNYALDGTDYWTDYTYLAVNRWVVLENDNIRSNFQICLQMDTTGSATESSALHISPSGDYSNSTTETETVRPTASDELELDANFLNLSSVAGTRRVDVIYSSDEQCWFMFATCNGSYQGELVYIGRPKNADSTWTNPWVAYQQSVTAARLSGYSDFETDIADVVGLKPLGEGPISGGWLVEQTRYQTVDNDGDWFVQPLNFLWSTDMDKPGFWGELYDWWVAPPALVTGTQFPATGATTFIKINDLMLPWDDTVYP